MTKDFEQYVLTHVPTKILLREFKYVRPAHYRGWCTSEGYHYNGYYDFRVRIIVGKFASWNPYKGHGCECLYPQDEVKQELDKRENIKKHGSNR